MLLSIGHLSEQEKDVLSRMNNFFCGLHLLVGFAGTAEKVIHKFEAINNDAPLVLQQILKLNTSQTIQNLEYHAR